MKKITLVLCACAMAFAGLLVSCNNNAGDTTKLINRDTTSYDNAYEFSATKVVTVETATNKATLLTTEETTTSFTGLATITYSENDDVTEDYKNYTFAITDKTKASSKKVTSYSGTAAASQTAVKDAYTVNDSDFSPAPNSSSSVDFYEFDGKFYLGEASDTDTAVYTDAYLKDTLVNTITVDGDIAEGDTLTIVVTEDPKDTSTGTAVNKTTTVWTYKLTKAGSAE